MKRLLLFAMAIIFAMQLSAQTTIVAGDSTSTNLSEYVPINHCYEDAYTQMLYRAEELQAGGIQSISFYCTSGGFSEGTVKIYLHEVTNTSLTTIIPSTEYTEVYSGPMTNAPGWVTFDLDNIYPYTGGNLLVTVIRDGNAYDCSTVYYKTSPTSFTSVQGVYDDYVSYTVGSMPAGWEISDFTARPVMKMEIVELDGFCYRPSNLTVSEIDQSSATISWSIFDETLTTFGLAYKAETEEEWTEVSTNITDLSYTLTGLDSYTRYDVKVWTICAEENSSEATTAFVTYPQDGDFVVAPYNQNFDDLENVSEWHFESTALNQWFIGSVVNNALTEDGEMAEGGSLYVSNDGGNTNSYNNSASSVTHAYTLFSIEEGSYYGVSFDTRFVGETCCDYLVVSVVPLLDELTSSLPSAAYQVATITNTQGAWERVNIPLSNTLTPNIYKLVFSWRQDSSDGENPPAAIDNLSIMSTPCARVNDFEVTMEDAGGSVTMYVAVTDEINEGAEYFVEYRYAGDTTWYSAQSESPVEIPDLPYSSRVDYRVTADCSGDLAVTSDVFTVWSTCSSISTIPYVENFDTNIFIAIQDSARANRSSLHCWYNVNGAYSSYYWSSISSGSGLPASTAEGASNTKALYFYGTTSTSSYNFSDWMISPIFELTGNERLNFQYKLSSNTNSPVIDVYAMNVSESDYLAMSDTANFTLLTSINTTGTATGQYNMAEIFLNEYEGNTRIALAVRQKSSSFYIDDFSISEIPACPDVYGLQVNPGDQVAYVSYDTGNIGEDGVTIAYAEIAEGEEFDPTSATTITIGAEETLPYQIEGLTTGSTYAFAAQQACGGNWSNVVTITIPTAYSLPINFDFDTPETTPEMTFTGTTNPWVIGTAQNNTVDEAGNPTSGGALYVSNDNGASASYTHSNCTTYAKVPISFTPAAEFNLSFDWKCDGESSFDNIAVYLVPFGATLNEAHNITLRNGNTYLSEGTSWQTYSKVLSGSNYAGIYELVFRWKNDGTAGQNPSGIIDNIVITSTNCSALAVDWTASPAEDEEGNMTIVVNLTDEVNEGATYNVTCQPSTGGELITIENLSLADFPITIEGMSPITTYNVSVSILCDGDEIPSPVGTQTITTPCQAEQAPWFEDFSSTSLLTAPSCWNQYSGLMPASGTIATSALTSTSYWSISTKTLDGVSSTMLRINLWSSTYKYWAVTPSINLGTDLENPKQIAFSVAVTDYSSSNPPEMASPDDRFMVLVSRDNGATWNMADGIVFADGDADTEHNFADLTNHLQRYAYKLVDENDEPLTGTVRFAFYAESTVSNADNDLVVEDIAVEEWSACPAPYGVGISSITSSTATASFGTWGPATTWEYVVVEGTGEDADLDGATPVEVATTEPIELTDLNPLTEHTFGIRSVCEEGPSNWVTATFLTLEAGEAVPYSTSFDDADDAATWHFTQNSTPNVWAIGAATAAEEGGSAAYISTDNGETYSASLATSTTRSYIWKDFDFGETEDAFELSFDWKIRGRATEADGVYNGILVYLVDDLVEPSTTSFPSDAYRLTLVYGSDEWTNERVYLGNVTGEKRLLFLTWGYTNEADLVIPAAIDNVSIDVASCTPPATPEVTALTSSTATIEWVDEEHTSWNVYYKTFADAEYTQLSTATPSIELTELISDMNYYLYVTSVCGAEESAASGEITFRTECAALEAPFTDDLEGISNSQCWTKASGLLAETVTLVDGGGYWGTSTTTVNGNSSLKLYNNVYGTSKKDWIMTPQIDLGEDGTLYQVSIDVALTEYYAPSSAPESAIDDKFAIVVSEDGGITWSSANALIFYDGDDDTDHNYSDFNQNFTRVSFALQDADGNPLTGLVKVAFYAESTQSNGDNDLYLDNLAVEVADEQPENPNPDPEPCDAPTALAASNITQTSADITWNGTATTYEFRLNNGTAETLTATTKSLTGLTASTTYTVEVRAICGEQQSAWVSATFTTLAEQGEEIIAPVVTTLAATAVDYQSAVLNGTITPGNEAITAQGFKYKATAAADWTTVSATGTTLLSTINGLTAETSYTFKAFATTASGTVEGAELTFTTAAAPVVVVEGQVTTTPATEVGNTSATLNGTLVSAGNSENFTVGFALSTMADFTLEDAGVQNVVATLNANTFSQSVNDLVEGQTYFFRAYITNEAGTTYGTVETFTLSGLNDAIANQINAVVYPNPANTQATLEINGLNQDAKVVISDLQGRILSQDSINAGTSRYTINVSDMASGVYYIRIVTDNVISTQKLIVE